MTMIQRRFYLPEDMYRELQLMAKSSRSSITDVLRDVLQEGLERKQKERSQIGTSGLLDIARMAQHEGWNGPADLASHHDLYLSKILDDDLNQSHAGHP